MNLVRKCNTYLFEDLAGISFNNQDAVKKFSISRVLTCFTPAVHVFEQAFECLLTNLVILSESNK